MGSCPKLAEGDIVRVTRVDGCGAPEDGADNGFVDDCFVSVAMNPNTQAGVENDFRAMNGSSCGFKRGRPSFRGFDITANFFSASPELIELMTGNPVYLGHDGEPIGWDDCGLSASGFALEIWQLIVGEDCPEGADALYFYWLLPWIENGLLGNIEISETRVQFSLTGNTRSNSRWQLGPYLVQPADAAQTPGPLLEPLESECHRRAFVTTIAPPEAACDYILVPPVVPVPS